MKREDLQRIINEFLIKRFTYEIRNDVQRYEYYSIVADFIQEKKMLFTDDAFQTKSDVLTEVYNIFDSTRDIDTPIVPQRYEK